MSAKNTLFSYFSPKPKAGNTEKNEKSGSEVLTPLKNGNKTCLSNPVSVGPGKTTPVEKPPPTKSGSEVLTPLKNGNKPCHSNLNSVTGPGKTTPVEKPLPACRFKPCDVVWAKLQGYPWWPSLVCKHPKSGEHTQTERRTILVHVQFFDDPPTRGWVKEKYTEPFTGSDSINFKRGGPFFTGNIAVQKGAVQADKAIKLSQSERLKLIVCLESSEEDDEEDEAEEEDMETDGDLELDSSKENAETPNKSPKKTPKKLLRSAAQPKSKRRRIVVASDSEDADSADEFKPPASDNEEKGSGESSGSSGEEETSESGSGSDEDSDLAESPVKKATASKPRKPQPTKRKRGPGGKPVPRIARRRDSSESNHSPPSKKTKQSPKSNEISEQNSSKENISKENSNKENSNEENHSKENSSKENSSMENSSMEKDNKESTNKLNTSLGSFTPSISNKTKSRLSLFSAPESSPAASGTTEGRSFPHLTHDFLKPGKIKDRDGHKEDHPEFSTRTLHVPDSFMFKQTPAMKQWWDLKSHHYDTVLFFKMGKFYELFHMDAVIAVNELGLIYMKGDHAHSGFPEIAYGRYAESLLQKGYKVARIEQTETPEMANERCQKMGKSSKFDKVVRREVCSVQTRGTKRYSFIDGDASDTSSAYLLAVCEKVDSEAGSGKTYGVCFVDTSIGKFHVGQFEDDRHSSRLRTLISHYPPAQVLTEKTKLSEKTQSLLTNCLPSALRESLRSGSEFWDSTKTLKTLSEAEYFIDENDKEKGVQWPEALKTMVSQDDALGHTAADECDLGVSALGAIIWYLMDCLMDQELLSMCNFEKYVPIDAENPLRSEENDALPAFITGRQKMVLDAVTLTNLDILVNSATGTVEGTLIERLDNCSTPFGKRVFKQWLCGPLCNPTAINNRLDAIDDLIVVPEITSEVILQLKKLPDLERLLSKIHTLGSANRSKNHPDGRAIFFEDVAYSKRKIEDFIAVLDGFKTAVKLLKIFESKISSFSSKLLIKTVSKESDSGRFPDLSDELEYFERAFNHQTAKTEGVIKPASGVDEEYDTALADIKRLTKELNDYLDCQKKRIGCRNIVYWGTGKNRFQMEIPESAVRNVPDDYEVASSKKGYKRYKTPEIEDKLIELIAAEDHRDTALKDIMRRIFFVFDRSYTKWDAAVQCLSVLDVLVTLSQYSRSGDGVMCRPQFLLPSPEVHPHLEIREARHPCISRTFTGSDFIPNDTVIGIKDEQDDDPGSEKHAKSRVVLVTGPNMGGKSTLMRQVGIITVMAQLGCYVPAEKCVLTPVDRVFTRLGASDRIMAGESTFFVELSETSSILQHATRHSLVLLDELGRGTATYDGTAIACSVVNELSQNLQCRTLFSTHYHSLVEEFSHDPNVRLGHMACMVEKENEEDPTQETITFLYKFVKGACPKSYGFNAARLADIPDEIISVAHKKAREFQAAMDQIRHFRTLCKIEKAEENLTEKLKDILQEVPA